MSSNTNFAMEFLFKDRGRGKRQVKPKQDLDLLEAQIIAGDSDEDDADFKVEDDVDNSDRDSDRSSSDDSSSSGDEDDDEDDDSSESKKNDLVDKDELFELRKDLSTEELLKIARERVADGPKREVKVCGCCLGHNSNDANEIVECDGCGISVHEGCYGVPNEASPALASPGADEDSMSEVSAASTEPWFCEPCRAGVQATKPPPCQLCPVLGGIYKQTDVGSWVHLVCALYVPGVAFGDPERLTHVTLFETNYTLWGRKKCHLCQDARMAKTGMVVQCDAGLCKSFFHASCAQAGGLLTEPSFHSEPETDPYLAHCKVHTDKSVMKERKLSYASHLIQSKRRLDVASLRKRLCEEKETSKKASASSPSKKNQIKDEEEEDEVNEESEAERILRKLRKSQVNYSKERARRGECWIPTQKIPRLLTTSSSAIRKLERMGEIKGFSVKRQRLEEQQALSVLEAKKRWFVQPSFSVEFVAYYQDRDERIQDLRKRLSDKLKEDEQLRERETRTRPNFDLMTRRCESAKETNEDLRKKVSTFRDVFAKLRPDKKLPECRALRPLFRPLDIVTPNVKARATLWGSSTAGPSSVSPKTAAKRRSDYGLSTLSLKTCQLCKKTKDQHLLAHCDTCRLHYHLGCLTPPLTRMPRKSKLYGWQCSECDRSSGDEAAVEDPSAPRKKRQAAARALAASRDNSDDEEIWEQLPIPTAPPTSNNRKNGSSKKSEKSTASNIPNGHDPSVASSSSKKTPSVPSITSPPQSFSNSYGEEEAKRQSLIDLASAKEERKKQKKAAKEARRAEKRRRREERKRRRREEQGDVDTDEEEEEESPNEMEMIEMPDGQCIVNIKPKKPIKLKIKAPQQETTTSNGVDSNGHTNNGDNDEEASGPPPAKKIKKKRSSTSDTRSWCDSCSTDGTNGNLVRCDECQKCYHFWCLSPPVKKSPKVAGYGWQCNNCSPSEVDSDWHLD